MKQAIDSTSDAASQPDCLSIKFDVAALFPVIAALYMSLHLLKASWDDGAITAAFSRTWVDSGRIALTPSSPVVEGFSSITWFLLLTLPRYLTHSPDAILIWMKCASAASAILLLWVFFGVARDQFNDSITAAGCVLLLAFSTPLFYEIQNGMEMNLAAVLLLLLFYVLRSSRCNRGHPLLAWILGALLLITRFESPFWLLFLFLGAWYERERSVSRQQLIVLFCALAVSFATIELWRYRQFGLWMPNTVYAKRWMPYRDVSSALRIMTSRAIATREILLVLPGIALVTPGLIIRRIQGKSTFQYNPRPGTTVWMLVTAAILFGLVFGTNIGHPGRMIHPALPFLILAMVHVCMREVRPEDRRVMLRILVIAQVTVWLYSTLLYHGIQPMTIALMEKKGIGADTIRRALHKDSLVVMLPDVGGSSLCCENLRIVDSGLLTSPFLARVGWPAFEDYFRSTMPEVIETHEAWAEQSHIYTNGLLNNYQMAGSNGERFFVRNDLYQRLLELNAGDTTAVESTPSCLKGLPGEATIDDVAFSRTRKTCLVLR